MTHRNEIPKATPIFLGSGNPTAPMGILSDVTGSRKSKMAAIKQEVPISQLLYKIATPFQRLTPICGVHQLSSIANTAGRNRKSEFKYGGRQTTSTYISASRLDINAVPTVNLHFRLHRTVFVIVPLNSWTPKMGG